MRYTHAVSDADTEQGRTLIIAGMMRMKSARMTFHWLILTSSRTTRIRTKMSRYVFTWRSHYFPDMYARVHGYRHSCLPCKWVLDCAWTALCTRILTMPMRQKNAYVLTCYAILCPQTDVKMYFYTHVEIHVYTHAYVLTSNGIGPVYLH